MDQRYKGIVAEGVVLVVSYEFTGFGFPFPQWLPLHKVQIICTSRHCYSKETVPEFLNSL